MAEMRNEASSSNSSGNSRGESVVIDVGRRRSSCGYCKSGGRTSISHGLWADSLTVDDYQALLDRGWRRSGSFLYKPEMERTCCPSYTIRLKASDFIPSKEQLRVAKRMQRFLDGTLDAKKQDEITSEAGNFKGSCSHSVNEIKSSAAGEALVCNAEEKKKAEQFMHYLSNQINNAVRACIGNGEFPCDIQLPKASVKRVSQAKRKRLVEGSEVLLYSSNVSFQIAAVLRQVEKDVHHPELSRRIVGENDESLELTPKMIAEKLAYSLNQLAETSDLSIKACNGHINFYSAIKQACLDEEVNKFTVSKESPTGNGSKRSCLKICERPQVKRQKIEILLKRSSFDPEEYALYRRYQLKVHNDTPDHVTESSYRRFLVDTPLVFVPSTGDGTVPPCGFGSFHQQYVIDGRLVAVGVIDILPNCLSSKYLFWDPDLAFLSLGKYSAIQEVEWVKENQVHCPSLQYYYLGYYIHSCSKMRYKAAYRPSELLCPLRYQWIPFDIARPLLDRKPYVVLSDSSQNVDSSAPDILGEHTDQHDDPGIEDSNDVFIDENEEMADTDSEDSDDESGLETNGLTSPEIEGGDVSNILIGLKGSRLRYKIAIGPPQRTYLETQLHRYMRTVGVELSERMVYSLG
ncbi:arginyl-tRNA--protein transferase 2-like isoform X2 [Cornus florida]|uniref:arginyl-tRNA--protein transferase 2-like isoform X2 n=1 Tax=Cornus florida TaxID=4283 RepID=UPI0028A14035|nr:arginyl-tRNA--protein transferase 2-like isoform X2 [Cornus florida]